MNAIEIAEYELQVQRNILWGQREGLRSALSPAGSVEPPDFWHRAIANTEKRVEEAETALRQAQFDAAGNWMRA